MWKILKNLEVSKQK